MYFFTVFVCFVVDGLLSPVELLDEDILKKLFIGDLDVDADFDDGIFVLVGDIDESFISLRSWEIESCDVAFVVHHVVFLKC